MFVDFFAVKVDKSIQDPVSELIEVVLTYKTRHTFENFCLFSSNGTYFDSESNETFFSMSIIKYFHNVNTVHILR